MFVLVIGASSGIGLQSVRHALQRGHRVRALARSADRIAIDDPKLERRRGDALDHGDVTSALDQVDAVIQTLGIPAGPGMVLGPVELFSASTRVLVAAMESVGVKRLISVTGFGAGDSRSRLGCLERIPFELVLGRAYADKDEQEMLVRGSGLDWTIVRPVILTDGPRTGQYEVLVDHEEWRSGFVSRSDVADFLVEQVDSDRYIGATPVLRSRSVLDCVYPRTP